MLVESVDENTKREIWKRDEFTCRYCGRTVPWENVNIVFDIPPKKGMEPTPSNMLTVCSDCLKEGKTAPVQEKDKQRMLGIIRELVCYTDLSDEIIFEMDHEQELERLSSKIEALKEDNRKLSEAISERERHIISYKEKMERAYKDMENLKRRQETDVNLMVGEGTRNVLLSMISTLDDIERAIQEARKDEKIKEVRNIISGLGMIRKATMDRLSSMGAEVQKPLGSIFDPRYHEATSFRTDKSVPKGTILEVLQSGFIHNSHLLRPAKVIIAKGGPKPKKVEEELEEFELEDDIEEEKVLHMEPWNPEDDEYVVSKPKVKKKKKKRVLKK